MPAFLTCSRDLFVHGSIPFLFSRPDSPPSERVETRPSFSSYLLDATIRELVNMEPPFPLSY